ncbi:RESISTANCE PROTEIN RGA2 putative-RELATED [Salix purpurea]|uniref:RESISTANCE PROTEIN RGA2 putative-RELATED n=1 Tax=Salix purpurea TaxID=77065 RepID=A0A9Q0VR77_SALPP|nr:RESISTANCE PROTEIN RGA2 putative-RELATED [Salix purpurea]
MVASLVQLQSLYISDCEGLEQIIAKDNDDEKDQILSGSDLQSLCFPNLCQVEIYRCNKLRSLFPVAMASCLPKLQTLDVEYSSQLLGVFGQDDDASPVNVEKQMAHLQGHTNLREIHITDCKGAQDRRTGHELSLLSLEKLHLSFLPDMRCIWKGLVPSHLTTLEVTYCEKLTHVFTGSMVASLVQLQFLKIYGCSELEQIIAKDNDDEKDQILSGSDLQSLCFPNLLEIEIKRCSKLRNLFPVAMAAGLPKLQSLEVTKSSQLLGVFGKDDHASPVNVEKQMVFPNLSFLRLNKLPSIVCFSLGCDDFLFPRLGNPMVHECPKLTTKFARKTNGSTSAQSEVLLIRL